MKNAKGKMQSEEWTIKKYANLRRFAICLFHFAF
jgi:hypothetical protein